MAFHRGRLIDHVHIVVKDLEKSRTFYRKILESIGRTLDNGAPGERNFHPGYFAAFVLDPDGNNLEAVFHGEADRSADSVVISPKG